MLVSASGRCPILVRPLRKGWIPQPYPEREPANNNDVTAPFKTSFPHAFRRISTAHPVASHQLRAQDIREI